MDEKREDDVVEKGEKFLKAVGVEGSVEKAGAGDVDSDAAMVTANGKKFLVM